MMKLTHRNVFHVCLRLTICASCTFTSFNQSLCKSVIPYFFRFMANPIALKNVLYLNGCKNEFINSCTKRWKLSTGYDKIWIKTWRTSNFELSLCVLRLFLIGRSLSSLYYFTQTQLLQAWNGKMIQNKSRVRLWHLSKEIV